MKAPSYLFTFALAATLPVYAQNPGTADLPTDPAPAEEPADATAAEKSAVGVAEAVDLDDDKVPQEPGSELSSGLSLFEIASGFEGFTTLMGAVEAADLGDTLKDGGPFTLFAPTNEAFEKLPEGVLAALLLPENVDVLKDLVSFHLVPAKLMAADIKPGEMETVQGEKARLVALPEGVVTIQGATITRTDVVGKNGVIHVVNEVLLPGSFVIEDYSAPAAADADADLAEEDDADAGPPAEGDAEAGEE